MADKEQVLKALSAHMYILKKGFPAAKDAVEQKDILDHGTAILKKIDADETLKAELQKERAVFEAQLKADIASYNGTASEPYSYTEPKDVTGDREGEEFEQDMADAGDKVNQYFKNAYQWCVDFVTPDSKKKTSAEADKGKEAKADKTGKKGEKKPDASKDKKDGEKGSFFDGFNVGDILGGLVGIGGGALLGTMFGGGWVGIILGLSLGVAGMFIGKRMLSDKINHYLGRESDIKPGDKDANQKQKQKKYEASPVGNDRGNDPEVNAIVDAGMQDYSPELKKRIHDEFDRTYLEATGHSYVVVDGGNSYSPTTPYVPASPSSGNYRQ